ncbi:MAG: type II toxin-antitoxin system PemK/MazF family toxin [Oscillospiraceae bacterium]|nr:type II toxin-antitoxin system PemK/MazF family toxin [Oscillospiraceae bacterium]
MTNRKIEQGDIIKLNLNPTKGHEQAGFRPVIVVSNEKFNTKTNLLLICPISNTVNNFPLHVKLEQTETTGEIRCEQVKAIDPNARPYTFVEAVPKHILQEAVDIVYGSVEVV